MRNSFGLNSDYMESVYEQFFYLKYYGGWSFIEAYNLPVGLRKWFTDKLVAHMQKEADEVKASQKRR